MTPWHVAMKRLLLALLCAAAIAACDRVVDLTPPGDARAPDAGISVGNDSGRDGAGGMDGGIHDDGGSLPPNDSGLPDA